VNKQVFGRLGLATIKQGGFTWTVVSAKQHRGWVVVVRAVAAQERGRDKPPAVLGSPETAGRAAEERGRAGERKEVIVLDLDDGWRESR
jgi:hypothetical protein